MKRKKSGASEIEQLLQKKEQQFDKWHSRRKPIEQNELEKKIDKARRLSEEEMEKLKKNNKLFEFLNIKATSFDSSNKAQAMRLINYALGIESFAGTKIGDTIKALAKGDTKTLEEIRKRNYNAFNRGMVICRSQGLIQRYAPKKNGKGTINSEIVILDAKRLKKCAEKGKMVD